MIVGSLIYLQYHCHNQYRKKKGQKAVKTGFISFEIDITLSLWSTYNDDVSGGGGTPTNATYQYSRWLGIFTGFLPDTVSYPSDFDPGDFSNEFQIFFPGWYGNPSISYLESTEYGSTTADLSFPITNFRTFQDVVYGNAWFISVDSQSLNKVKTVSKSNSTFPLASLFAALLSIVNISLTVYALIFPTSPMVVSQTYFRFKEPHKFDPSKDLSPTPARGVEMERLQSPSAAAPAADIFAPAGDK